MDAKLRSSIDLTPMVGLLLALLAITVTSVSASESASGIDLEPPVYPAGSFPPIEYEWTLEVGQSGDLQLLWADGETRRTVTLRQAIEIGLEQEHLMVRGNTEVPYGVFAHSVAELEAAGVQVGLIDDRF